MNRKNGIAELIIDDSSFDIPFFFGFLCSAKKRKNSRFHCLLLLRAYACYLLKLAMVRLLLHPVEQVFEEVKDLLE